MRTAVVAAVLFAALVACPAAAEACPMCKAAAESDERLPRAFFASILFMMGMPIALATGFGVAFWRLSRQTGNENLQDWPAADGSAEG
ncbi:hypothetical protein [Alienimonas californiensis]|uniref:Uncharacterized protein n=1 Tax=Alienimonas californiensis TaxID=2527989 RepID=A0A517PE97_9PLAN|nr:hypothetical protein [Alienimonas californiensis]QDT17693.1 hypothetical protein CA12_38240 [Alienimonas californiensis]